MKQILLGNGNMYELVPGGVYDMEGTKLQLVFLPGEKAFSDVESDFENEDNTKVIKAIDRMGEIVKNKRDFIHLDSIEKINDYVVGSEEYIDENGDTSSRNVTGVVYKVILSKTDLREQVNNLQETVDFLVLEGLGV